MLTLTPFQDDAGRRVLAVGQPVVQRPGQLHQPQRRLAHFAQVSDVRPVWPCRADMTSRAYRETRVTNTTSDIIIHV